MIRNRSSGRSPQWLARVLGPGTQELSCEECFEALDRYVDIVLARLDDYRGESRFTTWAWKFAFYEACVVLRKRRWLEREVPSDAAGWDELSREAEPAVRA